MGLFTKKIKQTQSVYAPKKKKELYNTGSENWQLKGGIDKFVIIVEGFNTPLSVIDINCRQN